jgi:HAE1 family hydrophobic/amphiphilic exporter-1
MASVLVILVLSLATWLLLPAAEYLPAGNRNLVLTTMDLPPGMNLAKMEEISDKILVPYLKIEEAHHMFSVISDRFQIIGIIFKNKFKDKLQTYIQQMREMTKDIAGARLFTFQASIFQRGLRGGKNIEVNVRGDDLRRLEKLSLEIEREASTIEGVVNTDSSFKLGNPELQVTIDRERASDLSVSAQEVAQVVETLVAGREVSVYREEGNEIDLTLRGEEKDFLTVGDLERILFTSQTGRPIHLSSVARVVKTEGPTRIDHIELDRSITLTIFVETGVPIETVMKELNQRTLNRLRATIPQTYSIDLSGSADDLTVTRRALTGSFILAVIIIYLLISALFESFLYPLIILFTVPLAASGAIMGVVISRSEFNVITMLGFIILSGIVVNMSILLVHQARNFMDQGYTAEEAIIESTRTRIRPIFMSTTTSILGMLPLTLGHAAGTELYKGLGAAIIGGLAFSTLFTLILTPVLLSLFLRVKSKFTG